MVDKIVDSKKRVGNYIMKFKTIKNEGQQDILLKVTFNRILIDIIKSVIVEGDLVDVKYYDGIINKDFKRNLVKSYVYSNLSDDRDLVFNKDLVNNGEVLLTFSSVGAFEGVIEHYKYNVKRMVEAINKCDIDLTVTIRENLK